MELISRLILVALIASVVVAQANLDPAKEWSSFKAKFNKRYTNKVEEETRMQIFAKNIDRINNHNKQYEAGLSTYKRGINIFSDLTPAEVTESKMGLRVPKEQASGNKNFHVRDHTKDVPDTVDWTDTRGVVTEVAYQGDCRGSWAFSAAGAIEGQWFLKKNQAVSLSAQNLIDCVTKNNGCVEGYADRAYDYIIANNGIDTSAGYVYRADFGNCQYDPKFLGATISNYTSIKGSDELDLQHAVATVGPVSVAFDGAHSSFYDYMNGIWDEPECVRFSFTHAALVVGYGTENGVDYWLLKNSWGTTWGISGYFKMRRNNNNECGIASYALYPVV